MDVKLTYSFPVSISGVRLRSHDAAERGEHRTLIGAQLAIGGRGTPINVMPARRRGLIASPTSEKATTSAPPIRAFSSSDPTSTVFSITAP
jgi:hypothetical protein